MHKRGVQHRNHEGVVGGVAFNREHGLTVEFHVVTLDRSDARQDRSLELLCHLLALFWGRHRVGAHGYLVHIVHDSPSSGCAGLYDTRPQTQERPTPPQLMDGRALPPCEASTRRSGQVDEPKRRATVRAVGRGEAIIYRPIT